MSNPTLIANIVLTLNSGSTLPTITSTESTPPSTTSKLSLSWLLRAQLVRTKGQGNGIVNTVPNDEFSVKSLSFAFFRFVILF